MKTKLSPAPTISSVQSQLGLCAAALAGTAAAIPTAQADIITYDTPVSVPQTFQGVYINLATGEVFPSPGPGWDFNPYSSGGTFAIYWAPPSAAGVATDPGSSTYADLGIGSVIGPSSPFTTEALGTDPNFLTAGTHVLGFRFLNEGTGVVDYGYAFVQTGAGTGFPLTIQSWSFENNGGPIMVVPEPTTTALLSAVALALGAIGVRRWRRGKAA